MHLDETRNQGAEVGYDVAADFGDEISDDLQRRQLYFEVGVAQRVGEELDELAQMRQQLAHVIERLQTLLDLYEQPRRLRHTQTHTVVNTTAYLLDGAHANPIVGSLRALKHAQRHKPELQLVVRKCFLSTLIGDKISD